MSTNLKLQAVSGVKWTTLSALVNMVVQVVQLSILTRVLDRSDFGVMAIVMVVIGFSQLFIDMGVSNAIIYKKNVTHKELSSLYWFNILIGVAFFLLLLSSAGSIAMFYNEKKLDLLLVIVAVSFLIQPWGQQFMVLLQKELKFKVLGLVEIVSRLLSFITVITFAYSGHGVYSLAFGPLIYSVCSTVGFNFFGRKYYRPNFLFNFREIKGYMGFGLFQMGDKFLNYFAAQMDTVVIGKLLGMQVLGVYNIAKDLTSKPYVVVNPIINRVTFPLMSKINDDLTRLKVVFLRSLNYLSFVNIFIYVLIIVLAEPIVVLLFGSDWKDVVPLIRILSLTYIFRSFGNPSGSLLLSFGKAKQAFVWNLAVFFLYPCFIFLGSYWGITGITISTFLLQVVLFVPNWRINVHSFIHVSFKEYAQAFFRPFLLPFLSALPCFGILLVVGPSTVSAIIISVFYTLLYCFMIVNYERNFLFDVLSSLPKRVSKQVEKIANKMQIKQ